MKMKKRNWRKKLKNIARKEEQKLKMLGYETSIGYLNQSIIVVRGERKNESFKIFINKLSPPFSTAVLNNKHQEVHKNV